ncbi:Complex two-component hybrid sensor component containing histidine kinase and response receiver domain [Aromatoleum aromaticum EbN1]|uniref:histidine kinase n=2 Tax=Aromatoleum aromaticum TaxID=551760 RepID=Q5P351_AROAE|nr:Complex two-component hybrid sensor component containing histidine kinase and response receiver domain [Aromatoleum aromaticum EbN1]
MLVAVLPTLVLAIVLTAFYTGSRVTDHREAHVARGQAFARQLAAASEYAVFSGNRESLRRLAGAMLAETDVLGVMIIDRNGDALAQSGQLDATLPLPPRAAWTRGLVTASGTLRVIEPVLPTSLDLDDGFDGAALDTLSGAGTPPMLGTVVVDISRAQLNARQNELLVIGSAAILMVLIGSLVLAHYMSRGVTGPIRRVASAVERIGRGQFSARLSDIGGGTLRTLAEGVNQMAAKLASAHEDMSRQIADATAELRARKDEAERATLSKSRFLAAASHDLRQPMHALGLFIAELSQHTHAPASRRLVERIAASAEAMENLLDSLLDISKLDAGVLEPHISVFPLQPILDRIAAEQRPRLGTQDLLLRTRPTPLWVESDPVLFERIIGNLVSNAVRYTRKGHILVACRRRGERVRIEVRDNGVGIAAEAHEIIFQEFIQLDNPARSRDKGLGLGLAIVRRLTDLLGHRLAVRSRPGRGSVFAIEVPVAQPVEYAEPGETCRQPGDLAGIRVALVDDDPLAQSGMRSLLTSWGCEVTAGSDIESVLETLARSGHEPQLIISDYRLHGNSNGIDAIRVTRARYGENLPAALISGDTAPETLRLAQGESLALLHKPVRPARLRALLNRLSHPERDF